MSASMAFFSCTLVVTIWARTVLLAASPPEDDEDEDEEGDAKAMSFAIVARSGGAAAATAKPDVQQNGHSSELSGFWHWRKHGVHSFPLQHGAVFRNSLGMFAKQTGHSGHDGSGAVNSGGQGLN